MKKFSEWVMALLFSGTLLVLMAATILLPKERYSYYENRNLSAFPEISVESVASGKVFGELETMFCDYAAWRTAALRAVTWCDLNLFHRPVVNEVVVTPDALLEELYTMPDTAEDIPFTRFDNGAAAEATVYALPGSDAEPLTYGLYMGGDIAETVIQTDRPELPNALIFGDSFTNPVECLAYYSFNELRSVDLRHYTCLLYTSPSPRDS